MRVVIADLIGLGGFVNKDTVVGGYGSRFSGFSWTTRWIERARKLLQNVPSIHAGYLAAIFEKAGHEVLEPTVAEGHAFLGLALTEKGDLDGGIAEMAVSYLSRLFSKAWHTHRKSGHFILA